MFFPGAAVADVLVLDVARTNRRRGGGRNLLAAPGLPALLLVCVLLLHQLESSKTGASRSRGIRRSDTAREGIGGEHRGRFIAASTSVQARLLCPPEEPKAVPLSA